MSSIYTPGGGGSGAGPAPAILANTQHVYACGDASGTTLADTGLGVSVAATLSGTANVAYHLASARPFAYGTKGLRLYDDTMAHSAQAVVAGMGVGAYTMECLATIEEYVASPVNVNHLLFIDDGFGNNVVQLGILNSGVVFAGSYITPGGGDFNTTVPFSVAAKPIVLGVPAHYMVVYDPAATPTLTVYRNGLVIGNNNQQTLNLASLTRITIGNGAVSLNSGLRGWIGQVRVSNVARPASYALANAEAMLAM